MSRARELAKLGNTDAIGIDGVDLRAGSVTKGTTLDVASDVKVVGVVTAANFFGEGSGLTGLTAVGSGVTVLRDDNSIGGASKINFDNTFTVTDLSSGITTIRSGVTTADPRSSTLVVAGISTLQNVTAGVATANQFSGPLTGVAVTLTGAMSAATLSVTGQSTLSNLNVSSGIATVAGQTTLSNLNVSGVTTAGIVTVNNNLFSANSTLSGITTITELNLLTDLEIAGFSTISNGGLDVVGVVTASSYRGDGSQLTGISGGVGVGTTQVSTSGLVVSGISTLAGATFSGISTATSGFDFKSTGEVRIGPSNQISISHNTSNGNITCDTGYQYIRGASGFRVQKEGGGYDDIIKADSDGAVELYYDDVKKIETATDGVYVAGIVTASTHVDSGIVTYRGDSSYSAAGRWVLGADGTNHYTFTGPGLGHSTQNDPTLYLKRGQTYMFENKMGAHPFRIQSTTNGATGTAWNVGVTNNDVSNGVLIFEVPFATPDTLYYQCTAHANMGGVINIA